jgi:hypothetical protein
VVDDEGAGETHFRIDSDDLGFDLQDMQQGESRSIIDKAGRSILVTRTGDGFSFDIDGKTFDLPDLMNADHHGAAWVSNGDGEHVGAMRKIHVAHGDGMKMNGTMIISPQTIDDSTQQAIRSLLESAGYSGEVDFMDREQAHGGNLTIMSVEKVVESPQT